MSGLKWTVNSGLVTYTAGASTVGLQISAPTNQSVNLMSLRVMGSQPAGGTDDPVLVKLQLCANANKGAGTAQTPVKLDQRIGTGYAIQSSAQSASSAGTWTTAPSSLTDNADPWAVNPQSGFIEHFDPSRYRVIPAGYSLNVLIVTQSGQTPALIISATCEE